MREMERERRRERWNERDRKRETEKETETEMDERDGKREKERETRKERHRKRDTDRQLGERGVSGRAWRRRRQAKQGSGPNTEVPNVNQPDCLLYVWGRGQPQVSCGVHVRRPCKRTGRHRHLLPRK